VEKELRLIDVNKKYKLSNKDYFQALYDINVEFEKGELVSIVGESGSGKSTLMNLIGGLDSEYTGQIIAGGQDLSKLKEKELDNYRKNKVGFVFQSFNLISHLSILDNVTLAMTLSNVGEKERVEKATKILKMVGLENQLKKKPTQLSGGQKQRVAIARALINDPEIIIADEPTGALDSGTSLQILEILKEIADSGKLVIMVTHSEKVASISSRVVEISDGKIVSDRRNENYQKNASTFESQNLEEDPSKKGKQKQNLSFWSSIRLSLHNMWASKVKNFLMAFGVSIGIGSLILMMCFSSGITDFIDNTMKSYSNPQIVTITKKGEGNIQDVMQFNPFTDEEKNELITGINQYLDEEGISFELTEDDITPGFGMMAIATGAKVLYNPTGEGYGDEFSDPIPNEELESEAIYYLYSVPPYYSETNIIAGEMGSATGGLMFTQGINNLVGENPIGKEVKVTFTIRVGNNSRPVEVVDKICGIMDTSIMSNFMVLYVDYDYLASIFAEEGVSDSFAPTTYYIKTDSEETTKAINDYLFSTNKYSGSIEDQLEGMFTSMSKTIGTSLVVISSISLFVSAMMILVVLYMSVSERTKEIGVLKSIGARRKDIKRIFSSESFLIGLLSGIFGIIFNLILTGVVYLILQNTIGLAPISYRWWYFAVAIGVSLVISVISGLYPASKAAKLDPVEALRRE